MNERITRAAWDAATGRLEVVKRPRMCLMLVRQVIEAALFNREYRFYDRFGVARTTAAPDRTDWSWWAADIEASMKQLGLAVPFEERQPGDLVFDHRRLPPYGHVGVLLDMNTVLENAKASERPDSVNLGGSRSLTPLTLWPCTLVARLPDID